MVEAGGVELNRSTENRQVTDFADPLLPSLLSLLAVLDQFGSMGARCDSESGNAGGAGVLRERADPPSNERIGRLSSGASHAVITRLPINDGPESSLAWVENMSRAPTFWGSSTLMNICPPIDW